MYSSRYLYLLRDLFYAVNVSLFPNRLLPLPILPVLETLRQALELDDLQVRNLGPLLLPPTPPRLAHQRHDRLLLVPALLDRHIRQVARPVAPASCMERDADAMHPQHPVHRIRGVLKVRQQRDGDLERRQLGSGYG
jgi:hypothetical protein